MSEHTGTNDDNFPPPADTTSRAPHLEMRPDTLILNSAAEGYEVFDGRILPERDCQPLPVAGMRMPDVTPRIDVVYRLAEHLSLSSPLFDPEIPARPSCESGPAAQRDEAYFLEAIRAYVARYLGCGTSAVVPEETFPDLGFDSVSVLELREWFAPDFGLTLPVSVFFEHRTPAALARYLSEEWNAGEARDQDGSSESLIDRTEPAPPPKRSPTSAEVPSHPPHLMTDQGRKKTGDRRWRSARLWRSIAATGWGVTPVVLWLLGVRPNLLWVGGIAAIGLLTVVLMEFPEGRRRITASVVGFARGWRRGEGTRREIPDQAHSVAATGRRRQAKTHTRGKVTAEGDNEMT